MGITFQGHGFKILTTTEPIGGEDGKRSFTAKVDEAENTIIIDGTMPESRQDENLLHELAHLTDMTLPEYIVNIVGRGMYGILKENGLLAKGHLVGQLSNGTLSAAEARKLNKQSNELAEQIVHGPLMGKLQAFTEQTRLVMGSGDMDSAERKKKARELVKVFMDLGEAPHDALVKIAR